MPESAGHSVPGHKSSPPPYFPRSIRTGQQILPTHHIPRVDPYSSIMSGKPWIAWVWLYDATVGALDSAGGLNGVVWFHALLIAATFAVTFRSMIMRGTK